VNPFWAAVVSLGLIGLLLAGVLFVIFLGAYVLWTGWQEIAVKDTNREDGGVNG
jgi:hypothetical protein